MKRNELIELLGLRPHGGPLWGKHQIYTGKMTAAAAKRLITETVAKLGDGRESNRPSKSAGFTPVRIMLQRGLYDPGLGSPIRFSDYNGQILLTDGGHRVREMRDLDEAIDIFVVVNNAPPHVAQAALASRPWDTADFLTTMGVSNGARLGRITTPLLRLFTSRSASTVFPPAWCAEIIAKDPLIARAADRAAKFKPAFPGAIAAASIAVELLKSPTEADNWVSRCAGLNLTLDDPERHVRDFCTRLWQPTRPVKVVTTEGEQIHRAHIPVIMTSVEMVCWTAASDRIVGKGVRRTRYDFADMKDRNEIIRNKLLALPNSLIAEIVKQQRAAVKELEKDGEGDSAFLAGEIEGSEFEGAVI